MKFKEKAPQVFVIAKVCKGTNLYIGYGDQLFTSYSSCKHTVDNLNEQVTHSNNYKYVLCKYTGRATAYVKIGELVKNHVL